jgi:hypothetical protein
MSNMDFSCQCNLFVVLPPPAAGLITQIQFPHKTQTSCAWHSASLHVVCLPSTSGFRSARGIVLSWPGHAHICDLFYTCWNRPDSDCIYRPYQHFNFVSQNEATIHESVMRPQFRCVNVRRSGRQRLDVSAWTSLDARSTTASRKAPCKYVTLPSEALLLCVPVCVICL